MKLRISIFWYFPLILCRTKIRKIAFSSNKTDPKLSNLQNQLRDCNRTRNSCNEELNKLKPEFAALKTRVNTKLVPQLNAANESLRNKKNMVPKLKFDTLFNQHKLLKGKQPYRTTVSFLIMFKSGS